MTFWTTLIADIIGVIIGTFVFELTLWGAQHFIGYWALFRYGADAASKFSNLTELVRKKRWDDALEELTETEIYEFIDKGSTKLHDKVVGLFK